VPSGTKPDALSLFGLKVAATCKRKRWPEIATGWPLLSCSLVTISSSEPSTGLSKPDCRV